MIRLKTKNGDYYHLSNEIKDNDDDDTGSGTDYDSEVEILTKRGENWYNVEDRADGGSKDFKFDVRHLSPPENNCYSAPRGLDVFSGTTVDLFGLLQPVGSASAVGVVNISRRMVAGDSQARPKKKSTRTKKTTTNNKEKGPWLDFALQNLFDQNAARTKLNRLFKDYSEKEIQDILNTWGYEALLDLVRRVSLRRPGKIPLYNSKKYGKNCADEKLNDNKAWERIRMYWNDDDIKKYANDQKKKVDTSILHDFENTNKYFQQVAREKRINDDLIQTEITAENAKKFFGKELRKRKRLKFWLIDEPSQMGWVKDNKLEKHRPPPWIQKKKKFILQPYVKQQQKSKKKKKIWRNHR